MSDYLEDTVDPFPEEDEVNDEEEKPIFENEDEDDEE